MADQRRYWILQTELSYADIGKRESLSSREENVSPTSEIRASDIVYLWSRREKVICGWGAVEGDAVEAMAPPKNVQPKMSVISMGMGSSGTISLQRKVVIKPQALFGKSSSLDSEQVHRIIGSANFERLFQDPYQCIDVSAEQVYELNRLILANGATPPIDPLTINPPSSSTSQTRDPSSKVRTENIEPRFNERLANATTISSLVERASAYLGIAEEQARQGFLDEAYVAFGFALSTSEQIEDPQLREGWTNRIRQTAAEFGVTIEEKSAEEIKTAEAHLEDQGSKKTEAELSPASEPVPAQELPKSSRPDFLADIYTEKDLVGIEDDVEAFAKLIAARAIDPPLSIGLFGDWGSGKTFFMRHLRKRIEEIARESEVSHLAQKDIAFYKRIVQIEFNAWHYSESNLWASLVEHIFQNLKVSSEDKAETIKERQEALLKKLEIENAAQLHAEAKEKEAEEKLRQKQEELEAVEKLHGEELKQLEEVSGEDIIASARTSLDLTPAVRGEINAALSATGVQSVSEAAGDFQDALSQASAVLQRAGNLASLLTRSKNQPRSLLMLLVVLFGAALIGIVVGLLTRQLNLSEFLAPFSALATVLTTAAVWIRKQSEWVSFWLGKVERAKQEVDKKIEADIAAMKAEQEKKMATHRQELELLRTKYNALRREREEAQRRVDEIREEIRQSTAAQLLGKFIQDRASSEDYRKHLGLLALIRRDFERLSNLLDEENKNLSTMDWKQEQGDEKNRINRIVLYIDDLDRCQPSQVVAVLQAVHLLLAFKLFIVVVGVDCRWVTQSLRKYYPELLRDTVPAKDKNGNAEKKSEEKISNYQTATSRDYLEKIFQIPFWLSPMSPTSTINLLNGMLAASVVKDPVVQTPVREIHSPVGQIVPRAFDESPANIASGSAELTEQRVIPEEPKPVSKPVSLDKFDLNPKSLDLRERELKFMEKLAPILGRSPRSVKRFVNIYRLIKVGLSPQEQVEFLKDQSPISQYQAVMILLAIEIGLPHAFPTLASIDSGLFLWNLEQLAEKDANIKQEIDQLIPALFVIESLDWESLKINHFARWVPLVSRYSFHTERS